MLEAPREPSDYHSVYRGSPLAIWSVDLGTQPGFEVSGRDSLRMFKSKASVKIPLSRQQQRLAFREELSL